MDSNASTKEIHHSFLNDARVSLCISGIAAIISAAYGLAVVLEDTFGSSDAEILYLITLAEWSRPFFILLAIVSLCFAYPRIWHPKTVCGLHHICQAKECEKNQYCPFPLAKITYKTFFITIAILVVLALMLPHITPGTN